MTRSLVRCCLLAIASLVLAAAPPAHAGELLANGDFELTLDQGWTQEIDGSGYINRSTGLDPDPDYEVLVRKSTGTGFVQLYQRVPCPTTDLEFSASVKIMANATSEAWAGATLRLSYVDYQGFTLGSSNMCARTGRCPWNDSATEHYMEVPAYAWTDYAFNLNDELQNVPGVNPADIKEIVISLYTVASDC